MKIQIVSDLHIEHRRDQKKFKWLHPEADVLVIAGDATSYSCRERLKEMLLDLTQNGLQIIYLMGNHEFYEAPSVEEALAGYQKTFNPLQGPSQITQLYAGTVEYSKRSVDDRNVRFICATLWGDLSNPLDELAVRGYPDFRVPGLTPQWFTEQHKQHLAFIEAELEDAARAGVVPIVVTHHCSSQGSVPERFKGDAANAFFTTELGWLMHGPEAPKVWIHGHTHDPFDYLCGDTRVICNPYGYPNEHEANSTAFDPRKIIEV